ncbi:MAG: glycosyltransferase family 2 protein [Ginsengibacter sp.]
MVSVVILTKNEETDIVECIKSLDDFDDIHLLDSGSSDSTVDIASKLGVHIHCNRFESFGKQRNFFLENVIAKYNWILFLDADERATPAFTKDLFDSIRTCDASTAGFYCCWKLMLENTWLKRSDNFPKWQFRVLQKGKAQFKDFGHGQKEDIMNGTIGYIKEPYIHYGFSKGWTHWVERHNRYATAEAIARLRSCPSFKLIFSKNSSIRNPALKSWMSKIPGWPFLRFCQAFFLNLGFLEGGRGFAYCVNMAHYEFLIQLKMRELLKNNFSQEEKASVQ